MMLGQQYVNWMTKQDWTIEKTTLPTTQRTLVMGILNVTPDSFSDGGSYQAHDNALFRVKKMIEDGVDIIDIGGESTRPGFEPVPVDEELERVIPIIQLIRKEYEIPISIDTYKAQVAAAAIEAGADIINDIGGLQLDPEMAHTVARLDVPVIVMHNREKPVEGPFLHAWLSDIQIALQIAMQAHIKPERIILDPGIGFGKTQEQNLLAMKHLDSFCGLGYPVLLGTSKKSIIGKVLDVPVTERHEGTAATVCLGIAKGASIVRVHDVKEMTHVVRMTDAMLRVRGL